MCIPSSKPRIPQAAPIPEPAPPPEEAPKTVTPAQQSVTDAKRKKRGTNALTIPLGGTTEGTSGLNIPV